MQVKRIAECSNGSILQYFRPSLSYHLYIRSLLCLFWSDRLRQVQVTLHVAAQLLIQSSLFFLVGAKTVNICGQLVYTIGAIVLASCREPAVVLLLSPTAGIMYATLFTMPYLLVAKYHSEGRVCKYYTSTLSYVLLYARYLMFLVSVHLSDCPYFCPSVKVSFSVF